MGSMLATHGGESLRGAALRPALRLRPPQRTTRSTSSPSSPNRAIVSMSRRGSIRSTAPPFNAASGMSMTMLLRRFRFNVRVVIERVPIQFWSVDGAEEILGKRVRVDRIDSRTLERGHTKTFSCWVWTNDVANIPTKHTLGVLP
ncbi:hypothetical protein ZWY2020_030291 [Hordeum vulgare]|nr:hypothetical protein ZWY2020_030291 [Hordeum vulgare]